MKNFPIIVALGGDEAALEVLDRRGGKARSVHALRMWRARGGIPGEAQRHLMAEADMRGIRYQAADFVLKEFPAEAVA